MNVSFSREFRYRNLGVAYAGRRGPRPGFFILGGIGVLLVCCICVGLLIGIRVSGVSIPNPLSSVFASATPTPDKTAPVPLKSKGLGENGLELTVTSFQRPLQVQGLTKAPPDQQFILVSVSLRNTRTSGTPIKVGPGDFKVKGDGGLVYDANPKIVTIENLMMAQDSVGPGKDLERELIFQIAKDDSGLKLYWTAGKTTRVFLLEPQQ
jgi:hypothetical protein